MELAQAPGFSFKGKTQYGRFWAIFRTAVHFLGSQPRSEVISIHQIGSTIRIRWRLLFTARYTPVAALTAVAAVAMAAVDAAADAADMMDVVDGELATAAAAVAAFTALPWRGKNKALDGYGYREEVVDLNSIYELDLWSGRIAGHTLDFRTPREEDNLLRLLQTRIDTSRQIPALSRGLHITREELASPAVEVRFSAAAESVFAAVFLASSGLLAVAAWARHRSRLGVTARVGQPLGARKRRGS
jgi:hypothetical protein